MSDSLQPYELQYAGLPCPSLSLGVCSDLCPLSQYPWVDYIQLILCCPSPPALNLSQHQDFFQWFSSLHTWPKYWSFSISLSNAYSGLISFRIDWFDLLIVQGTLRSLLQHHSLKTSVIQCSAFFMVQLLHPYLTTGKTIALSRWTFVGKVMSLVFNMLSRLQLWLYGPLLAK